MNLEINIETRININEVHELAKFIEETQLVSDSIIRKYDNINYYRLQGSSSLYIIMDFNKKFFTIIFKINYICFFSITI